MIKALIFDFDGLILDTEGPDFQSWTEMYAQYNCRLPLAVWAEAIGTHSGAFDPHAYLEEQLGRRLNRTHIQHERRTRYHLLIHQETVLPGVKNYLSDAKRLGLKLAVASSSGHGWVDGHLKRLGLLNEFEAVFCAEDVAQVKPDPALYLLAISALGVAANETIAFEDSPNGALAAKKAGLYCVAVPNPLTAQLSLDHADLQLTSLTATSLEELLAIIPQEE